MYWTDWGSSPHIRSASMDGSNIRYVISTNIHWPNGIAIDDQTQKLYWTDAYLDRIEMAELDGSHRRVLLSENVPHPYAIGIYKVCQEIIFRIFLKMIRANWSKCWIVLTNSSFENQHCSKEISNGTGHLQYFSKTNILTWCIPTHACNTKSVNIFTQLAIKVAK